MTHPRRRVRFTTLPYGLLAVSWFGLPGCGLDRSTPNGSEVRDTRASTIPAAPADMPDDLRQGYIAAVQNGASEIYDAYSLNQLVRFENPEQKSTTTMDRNGLFMVPHEQHWAWGLRTVDIGCVDSTRILVEDVAPIAAHNRVHLQRWNLDETYINGPLGLEQGFVLQEAPACMGFKSIRMEVDGDLSPMLSDPDDLGRGRRVSFVDQYMETRLSYTDLFVVDARGKTISAWMTVQSNGLSIEFDDTGAAYPLTIDPLIWTLQAKLYPAGGADQDQFGTSVSISGDTALIGARGDDLVRAAENRPADRHTAGLFRRCVGHFGQHGHHGNAIR